MMRRAVSCAAAAAAAPTFAVWPAATAAAASAAAAPLRSLHAGQQQRRLHTSSSVLQSPSDDASAALSVVPAGGTLPAAARAPIPKQKVQMYHKLLRQLRSPVKGDVPDTQGDDYLLGQAESESMMSEFPGLLSANLAGPGAGRAGKKRGVNNGRAFGKGGRKAATAKVWIQAALTKGTGDFYVNGYRYVEYFPELDHRWEVCAPFFHTGTLTDFDMIALVNGGGRSGQAGAIKHAAAKALQNYNRKKFRPILKKKFLLTRDTRVVERKKYGQKKARKQFTFVKR